MALAGGSAVWEWAFALQMGIHMHGGKFLGPSVQREARRTGNPKWGQVLLCLPLPSSTGQGVPREGSSLHPLAPVHPPLQTVLGSPAPGHGVVGMPQICTSGCSRV